MSQRPSEPSDREAGVREAVDVSTLLIELGRALKACRFYPPEHPARKSTLERSYQAWRADLETRGALELELRKGCFWLPGETEPVGRGSLDELAREFSHRGVRRLRAEGDLDSDGFHGLVAVLGLDPDEIHDAGGPECALAERVKHGVSVNGVDYASLAAGDAEPRDEVAEDAEAPAEAAAEELEDPDADLPLPKGQTLEDVDALAKLNGLLHNQPGEAEGGELEPEPQPDPAAEFVGVLRALDECRDDAQYGELIRKIAAEVATLAGDEPSEEVYRAILVLSSHATETPRSERQRTLAEEALFQLAAGPRLDDVVQRACNVGPTSSVRATQILLQLGAQAVPRLLDALVLENDPERRGQLNAVLIAMGEKATPEVKHALEDGDPPRARLAARLAGEIQNPAVVPYLRKVMCDGEAPIELVKEVAKSLQRIGGANATETLIDGVGNPRPDVAAVAAFCAGATGSRSALEPLVGAVRRALRDDEPELAREAIRALGKLERAEATPTLTGILEKRSLLGRRRLRDLKVAAVAALGRIPGDEARTCLERCAAGRGDAQVRRAAQTALERRAAS